MRTCARTLGVPNKLEHVSHILCVCDKKNGIKNVQKKLYTHTINTLTCSPARTHALHHSQLVRMCGDIVNRKIVIKLRRKKSDEREKTPKKATTTAMTRGKKTRSKHKTFQNDARIESIQLNYCLSIIPFHLILPLPLSLCFALLLRVSMNKRFEESDRVCGPFGVGGEG